MSNSTNTSLCLVASFKNESHILNEWIQHYINQGVDHFFLIDNGSDDNYSNTLENYNNITLKIDPRRYAQVQNNNKHFLDACKKYEWVIVCDLDEFIYARIKFKTIKEYLNSLDDKISQVFVPWKVFGSSGFDTISQKQPKNIVDNFTRRIYYNKDSNFQGVKKEGDTKYSLVKCIAKTKYLTEFGNHHHRTNNNNQIGADNEQFIHPNRDFYKIDENILFNSFLHLNHYAIQSYEWFMRVKATRGDISHASQDSCRTEKYFRDFNNSANDVDDFELKTLNSHLLNDC